ncbi:peptidylprolyl isomerase [Geminocystis sp. NIES-3709]|uniref:peptidylprolyl isomerase n=1 Tax=Geminocystis sp. NIES-3709 TaxID=1617448 RepID=UPI0005FCC71B|nr:peptidylprolyl isomerase [Geminocystis sp. NIES-3709]BAQ65254.1 alkaline phosphatase [Geminocystis sp. NIES-3709]
MTIDTNPFNTVAVNVNSNDTIVNLFQYFDDPFTTGKVATFNLYDNTLGSGEIKVLLYDQNGEGAPITVNNFLNYVNDGDYINSIIHRSIVVPTPFVIQGGGFTVNNLKPTTISTNPPIVNEFSVNRSNIRGTIAMAKLDKQPDSATSQWFFNLANNASNLDNQNGGFTVFGQVLSEDDLDTIDSIASLPTIDATGTNPAFRNLPVNVDPNNIVVDSDNDLVRFENITVNNLPELTFTIENNSNPNLVTPTINSNGRIRLDYGNNVNGVADIIIKATNLLGETQLNTLRVSVIDNLNNPLYRFQNLDRLGTYLFVDEVERQNVINNFPQFKEEGYAFNISQTEDDDLIVFNRFRNSAVSGTYLYAGEAESQQIRENFPQFIEEGEAFYAYDKNANRGVDIYRFHNTQQPGTYIFVGEEEKNSILANFPQFQLEGVAFEVLV